MSRADLPPRVAAELVNHFGSPEGIFAASPVEIAAAVSLTPAMLGRVLPERPDDAGRHDLEKLHRLGAHILALHDQDYPPLLRQIYDPPIVLYVKGDLIPADRTTVAIVGSRRCSPYGRLVAQTLARDLAARGITVVSGLATGIDAAAHMGALEGGGRTIGVMACGLDVPYPREHTELKERIASQGAVICEVPLGVPPTKGRFPMRNRIIAGLSLGVVVVEAPEQSGALITAHQAAEQGREVFAVPGSFNSLHSRGCHQLIREGAKLIDSVEGILEELQVEVALPARSVTAAISPGVQPRRYR